jgi:hypothetical protein
MRFLTLSLAFLVPTTLQTHAKSLPYRDTIPVELAEVEALLTSAAAATCDICQDVLNKTQAFLQSDSTVYASAMFTIREAVRCSLLAYLAS